MNQFEKWPSLYRFDECNVLNFEALVKNLVDLLKYLIIIITFCGLTACSNETGGEIDPAIKDTVKTIIKTDTISGTENVRESSLDDIRKKIISELNLCEYSDFLKNTKYYNCYDTDVSKLSNIKADENNYDNFVFEGPGGSSAGAIVVFCKRDGKYKKVQEDQGVVECILPTTTNGFYDLIIWHRAHRPDGENVLYKWNGRKYSRIKTMTEDDAYSLCSNQSHSPNRVVRVYRGPRVIIRKPTK